MSGAIYILYKLLSFSPLLNVSDDNFFGKVTKNSTNIRFSLFSFNLGQSIIYLFSFRKINNTNNNRISFEIFKVLKLKEVQNLPNLNEIKRKYNGFERHLNFNVNNYDVYKETLLYKITQVEARKSKSFNKYLAYIAIIAFIIPLYSSQFAKFYSLNNFYKVFFLIPLLYLFCNLLLFVFAIIRIETVNRTRFNFIRNSQNPLKAMNLALYYDWLVLEDESTVQTSIIKNIEKYMICIAIWSILLIMTLNVVQYVENNQMGEKGEYVTFKGRNITSTSEVFYLDTQTNSMEFLKENEKFFSQTKSDLLESKIDKIILIKNKGVENQQYYRILNFINTYDINNTNIIEIENDKNDQLQVIILKRGNN